MLPNTQTFTLKYLFTVEYIDGSIFTQPKDDKSKLAKSSAFYDVLHSDKIVKKFTLKSVEDSQSISVDLTTGDFEVNGVPVYVGDALPCPAKRELIFYRQHQHDTNVTYYVKTGNIKSNEPQGHRVRYFIGWQVNIKGKNYQQKIGIS